MTPGFGSHGCLGALPGCVGFTFRYMACQNDSSSSLTMTTDLLLELFAGFLTAIIALWIVLLNRNSLSSQPASLPLATEIATKSETIATVAKNFLSSYFFKDGILFNIGLLILRVAVGAMMIHHGQEKLADPQTFANNYVIPLHIPFPLFFANVAGYSEVIGSWLLILGVLSPIGAMALISTMAVAAYHHILFSGLNIYVLELVVLYLGASLAILLLGPGRFSFDAGIVEGILESSDSENDGSELSSVNNSIYSSNAAGGI